MFSAITSLFKKEVQPQLVMEAGVAEAYNKSRSGKGHRCFCYAPFSNMLFSQSGNVHVCCHNLEFSIGKYPEQSLREIWNSAKANELREHMRKYDLAHGCGICEADVKMRAFQEVRARHFDHIPRHAHYPTQMEFLVSNQCNLECVMCKGEFSSLIRKNREKLPPLATPYDKEFLRQLEEFIPYLHETRFSGSGEAFSIDMNYEIWEMLIRTNPKCVIMVQTNGTILTDRVKNMLARGNFQIGVSLDSLKKEVYESIRLNANLDKVMENIRYFSDYSQKRKMDFRLAMCVMRQNWREMPDFIRFCNSMNTIATFHKVWYPREYALNNLTAEQLTEIHDYLAAQSFTAENERQQQNVAHYRYFTTVVQQWIEEALFLTKETRKMQEEANRTAAMSPTEAMDYFREKLKNHLTHANVAEREIDKQAENQMNKLEAVLSRFDETDRNIILKKMCLVPVTLVADALREQPVEALLPLTEKFLHNEFGELVLKPGQFE